MSYISNTCHCLDMAHTNDIGQVPLPQGVKPGAWFYVTDRGQTVTVKAPLGTRPGQMVQYRRPAPQYIDTQIPRGVAPGGWFYVDAGQGRTIKVQVPAGSRYPDKLRVQIPTTNAPPALTTMVRRAQGTKPVRQQQQTQCQAFCAALTCGMLCGNGNAPGLCDAILYACCGTLCDACWVALTGS